MSRFIRLLAVILCTLLWLPIARAESDEIIVSAAASLTDAMQEVGKEFTRLHPGTVVRFNFGASGALQRQIEQGAPADVFLSASPREMDALQTSGRIETSSRIVFARNRLVLIAPRSGSLKGWEDLRSPSVRRVAISNPDFVPSGRYAKATLTRRGLWGTASGKAVYGENVRQTLSYVAGGNVEAGIVFATDARMEPKRVRVVATAIPGKDHDPILYPAAVLRNAPNAVSARRFTAFLRGREAQRIFARYGFSGAAGG